MDISENLTPEQLKLKRKNASNWGMFFGALSLIIGALICLIYLFTRQPWKFPPVPLKQLSTAQH